MERDLQQLDERRRKDFVWVERMSTLLDSQFRIGRFRFGLDPILNLIPYGGQFASFAVSLVLVAVMFRNGVRTKVVIKMLLNVIVDALLGAIPLVGYIFDFFNKANERNIKLLREHYFENKNQGSAKVLILALLGLVLAITVLTFYVVWLIAAWAWGAIGSLF